MKRSDLYGLYARTGIGWHDGYSVRDQEYDQMRAMHGSMIVVMGDDASHAQRMASYGFTVVSRPTSVLEFGNWNLQRLRDWVLELKSILPHSPMIQVRNEHDVTDEDANLFVQAADVVMDAGGIPFMGAPGATNRNVLWGFYDRIARLRSPRWLARCGLITHCYGWGHPPEYPYDAINQHEHPGAATYTDDQTWAGFVNAADITQRWLVANGLPDEYIPIIVGEGEPVIDPEFAIDNRYPFPDNQHHLRVTQAITRAFQTGMYQPAPGITIPVPVSMLGYCFWILADHRGPSYPGGDGRGENRKTWNSEAWFTDVETYTNSFVNTPHPGVTVTPDPSASRDWLLSQGSWAYQNAVAAGVAGVGTVLGEPVESPVNNYALGFKGLADKLGRTVVGDPVSEPFTFKVLDGKEWTIQVTTKGEMHYFTGGEPYFIRKA